MKKLAAMLVLVTVLLLPIFRLFRGNSRELSTTKEAGKHLAQYAPDWYEDYKRRGYDQQIYLPYYQQQDNRSCFTAAAAMVAAYFKKIQSEFEFNQIRAQFGDTTSVAAQLKALQSLGLKAEFRKDGDTKMIERELEAGRPVLVGWLHAGNLLLGEPPMCDHKSCGHWSVISGYSGKNSTNPQWVLQDPRGMPDLQRGGHLDPNQGQNINVSQARFNYRWEVDGPGTGWVILVDEPNY